MRAKVRERIQGCMSKPLKAASKAFGLCRDVAKASGQAGPPAFGKGVDPTFESLRDEAAALDISAVTEELRVLASVDELQSLRVDYLSRFAERGAAGSCFPESFATIKSLLDKRAAFGMFLKSTVRERWSEMECADFDANLEDGRCMLFWAESVLETARRLHATTLGEKADALQAMCPPKDKLDDPEILTSKEKQQLYVSNFQPLLSILKNNACVIIPPTYYKTF